RDGDWQPIVRHLAQLGRRYSRAGLPISAWYQIVQAFSAAIVAHAVAVHAAEPARLTALLLVLGEATERALTSLAAGYYAVKAQREQEATERHTRMVDAALDAVLELDEQGRITEFNDAAERTFGYARADVIGQPLGPLMIPARFREGHRVGLARVIATGDARLLGKRVEMTAMRADGSEFAVELALALTTRLDGSRSFIGFARDLTEQRRAEESLALRAHALEQAQFGIIVSDPVTGMITNVNPAYARIVGYEPAELIGFTGHHLIAPASVPAMAEIARVLRDRGHHTFELQLRRKDGSVVPVFASSSTAEMRSGAQVRISTVIDISERAQLEQARAAAYEARERSASRIEILSSTGHEFAASSGDLDALLALVARRLGEIIGEGCAVRLISPDGAWLEPSTSFYHRDPARQELARQVLGTKRQRLGDGIAGRVAETGVAIRVPTIEPAQMLALMAPEFRPMLARLGVASALAIPLRSHSRTIGAISLLRSTPGLPYTLDDQHLAQDLADRAGLAIDNAVLVATLEQRVAVRTAALETANHELEAFSYSVSHDLRTPLRAIDGFSRILLSDYGDKLDEDGQRYLHRILSGTSRMAGLIDDLLNLARIVRTQPALVPQDLSAIAADVIAELQKQDPTRRVEVHIAPGLHALADARLLRIMFENLLGNAWKFTAKHDPAQIWFGADDAGFYIRDTGAGFDMAYANKLFQPFQRLHTATEFDGSGIGLATVHRIVAHHGGRIWAEAEVGKGATFFFTLGESRGRVA
ncbi:MAG: PAS domain S-box protein, partial [Myxococcales bacterium]|nr:PAS domain S-box protein [Myxococcales bacterium]